MNELLKSFPSESEYLPLSIRLAGITYPDSNYDITRKHSKISVMEYIVKGHGIVDFEGELHPVAEGNIYFLYKNTDHHYYSDKNDPFIKIFLNIEGDFLEQIVTSYGISSLHFFYAPELGPIFQKIPKIITSDASPESMQNELQGVLIQIIASLARKQHKLMHCEEAVRMKSYLDSNLNRIVTASELSHHIFRSSDYCSKLFLREYGITPYQYQLKNKISHARHLLACTEMSISEISEFLGYSDAHYFSNLFFSKCGIRPLSYKKYIQNDVVRDQQF